MIIRKIQGNCHSLVFRQYSYSFPYIHDNNGNKYKITSYAILLESNKDLFTIYNSIMLHPLHRNLTLMAGILSQKHSWVFKINHDATEIMLSSISSNTLKQ